MNTEYKILVYKKINKTFLGNITTCSYGILNMKDEQTKVHFPVDKYDYPSYRIEVEITGIINLGFYTQTNHIYNDLPKESRCGLFKSDFRLEEKSYLIYDRNFFSCLFGLVSCGLRRFSISDREFTKDYLYFKIFNSLYSWILVCRDTHTHLSQ